MRVVIAGSRSINDYASVLKAIMYSRYDITEVVCGTAAGVDRLGEKWAIANGVPIKYMPADWNKHGKAAGSIRNREMAKYADAAVIVWDGESHGALNMINEMKRAKKPYYIEVVKSDDFIFFE